MADSRVRWQAAGLSPGTELVIVDSGEPSLACIKGESSARLDAHGAQAQAEERFSKLARR